MTRFICLGPGHTLSLRILKRACILTRVIRSIPRFLDTFEPASGIAIRLVGSILNLASIGFPMVVEHFCIKITLLPKRMSPVNNIEILQMLFGAGFEVIFVLSEEPGPRFVSPHPPYLNSPNSSEQGDVSLDRPA